MQRWVMLAALGLPAGIIAQTGSPFTSSVQLVEVYATVVDAAGAPLGGLSSADFEVFEDGVPREVAAFAAGELSLTVALGVDRSLSMGGERLTLARRASRTFLELLRPVDRSMVVAIGSTAEVIAPLGTDRMAQVQAIDALVAGGTTALHDAVVASLDRLEPESGRQALVVFSDGVDRYSRTSAPAVLERARRSQALIYPIVIGRTPVPLAAELAVSSGGRSFQLGDTRELESTLQTVATELRLQYLLGYTPAEKGSGGREWRSIRVSLKSPRPGVRIRHRDGYFTE